MITVRQSVVIMIVDDDEGHRLLIRESLRSGGIANQLLEFCDGRDALDYLQGKGAYKSKRSAAKPVMILLDIKMPQLDGFAVLEAIKSNPGLRAIPVVMLTSTDDQAEVNRCYAMGANSYIIKPVRYPEFQDRIKALGLFLDIVRLPD